MDTIKSDPAMAEGSKCARCGTPLRSGALGGLCPACLLREGALFDSVSQGQQPGFDPPNVDELAPLFPQLEVLELIGKGGMGAVYKARQKQLDRLVALKILPPGVGNESAFAERFTREAQALARLNHPGIVTLYEFGQVSNPAPRGGGPGKAPLFFFLMEFVDGVNLRQLLTHGRVSPREALAIVPQICDALQFAHDQGIVHRDIKPENILLDRRGRVKVADFGLAKMVGNALASSLSASSALSNAEAASGATRELTKAGKVMGTPRYMSPEQIHAPGEVDNRTDIYALGVVFYQMLTGELPGRPLEPPSKKVQIDVRLDEVVLRALEQRPELRYQQAGLLKTQLETIAAAPAPMTVPPAYRGLDYRSQATLFGLPWLHVTAGVDPATGKARVAKGIIAIGGIAKGVVAIGGVAMGGLAFGGLAMGGLAFGGCGLGLLACGGLAVALIGALGGGAIAPVAMGGGALGYLAYGGQALGVHVFDALTADPMAERFFLPWAKTIFQHLQLFNAVLIATIVGIGVGVPLVLQRRMARRPAGGKESDPPGKSASSGRTFTFPESAVFATISVAMLLVLSAWGNAVAMLIGAVTMLVAALFLFGRRTVRGSVLLTLASIGVAAAVVILLRHNSPKSGSKSAEANHVTKLEQKPVGLLRLIGAGAHVNIAIARSESVIGFPVHEIVVRFAGPPLAPGRWLAAKAAVSGPVLAPSPKEALGGDWRPEPVNSLSLLSNNDPPTNHEPSSCWFACPNECQLQFALADEAEAADASRQIRQAFSKPLSLFFGKRFDLFHVGDHEAWLEPRALHAPNSQLAFLTSDLGRAGNSLVAGRSPVEALGTNRVDSAVITVPRNARLTLMGEFSWKRPNTNFFSETNIFSFSVTNGPNQPGLYWLTWRAGSSAEPNSGWEIFIQDALTLRQLTHFTSRESPQLGWRADWAYESGTAESGELLEKVLLISDRLTQPGNGRVLEAFLRVKMVMRPSDTAFPTNADDQTDLEHRRAG